MNDDTPTGRRKPGPQKGHPACVAAGKAAGARLKEQRGEEWFREMGKKGGQATRTKGAAHFSALGTLGAAARHAKKKGQRHDH